MADPTAPDDLFSQLTPEQIQELMGLAAAPERSELIQQQIAEAQSLRKGNPRQHTTGLGAALGGLADVVNTGLGAFQEKALREQQAKNLTDEDKARRLLPEMLRGQQGAGLKAAALGAEPTEQEKAAATAKALRRQRDIGSLAMLTGDPRLAKWGQFQAQAADQEEQRLTQAPEQRLTQAMKQQQLGKSQFEQTEAAAPAAETYRQLASKFGLQLPQNATNYEARQFLDMGEKAYAADQRAKELALNRAAMGQTKQAAEAEKRDKEIEGDVPKLGKDLEETAQLKGDMAILVEAAKGGSIPGFGTFAGRMPTLLTSNEGIRVRQAAGRVMAAIMHKLSGSAVSEAELERALEARGLGRTATDEQFRTGLAALLNEAGSTFQRTEAKYKPEVVERFRSRGGVTSREMAPLVRDATSLGQPGADAGPVDIKTRIAQLKAGGMNDPATIKAQLAKEGLVRGK